MQKRPEIGAEKAEAKWIASLFVSSWVVATSRAIIISNRLEAEIASPVAHAPSFIRATDRGKRLFTRPLRWRPTLSDERAKVDAKSAVRF
jgi:hypothetical protein